MRCARGCSERSGRSIASARSLRPSPTWPPVCHRRVPCSSASGGSRAAARCPLRARSPCVRWRRRRTAAAPGPARRGRLPRRLVHDLHRAGDRRAAIELLEATGCARPAQSAGCCGRASVSKGLLDQARGMAADMAGRLAPEAERGVPIVGCEPSCLLTLREEHLSLLEGDPRAAAVASPSWSRSCSVRRSMTTPCAWIRLTRERPADRLQATAVRRRCRRRRHRRAARARPGRRVTELDRAAGNRRRSGRAGTTTLSIQVGESRLFPALRDVPAEALVAATRMPCRQQIAHGVGLRAHHPVELVQATLKRNQE